MSKITAALHAVMSQVSYVQKTGKNSFHGYSYAGEADLLAVLRPAMIEHGLMLFPSVDNVSPPDANGNVMVMMTYTLVHKDGEVWPEKLQAAGMGNDRAKNGTIGDKGVYKAITGANKYMLFKLFQIETGDDPEVVSAHDKFSEEAPEPMSNTAAKAHWKTIADAMFAATTLKQLQGVWQRHYAVYQQLPESLQAELRTWKDELKDKLMAFQETLNAPQVGAVIPPDFDNMEKTN